MRVLHKMMRADYNISLSPDIYSYKLIYLSIYKFYLEQRVREFSSFSSAWIITCVRFVQAILRENRSTGFADRRSETKICNFGEFSFRMLLRYVRNDYVCNIIVAFSDKHKYRSRLAKILQSKTELPAKLYSTSITARNLYLERNSNVSSFSRYRSRICTYANNILNNKRFIHASVFTRPWIRNNSIE